MYVAMTRRTCGSGVADTSTRFFLRAEATIMNIDSAAAVAPSYIEALADSMPVSSEIMD